MLIVFLMLVVFLLLIIFFFLFILDFILFKFKFHFFPYCSLPLVSHIVLPDVEHVMIHSLLVPRVQHHFYDGVMWNNFHLINFLFHRFV